MKNRGNKYRSTPTNMPVLNEQKGREAPMEETQEDTENLEGRTGENELFWEQGKKKTFRSRKERIKIQKEEALETSGNRL